MRIPFLLLLLSALGLTLSAQEVRLHAGPMLGYAELTEVLVWVQTNSPATVQLRYWPEEKTSEPQLSEAVQTHSATAYTAKLPARNLRPGTAYGYEILLNGHPAPLPAPGRFNTQPLWQWRTDPPTFTVATGSCVYINEPEVDRPGTPYGGDYHIFSAIEAQKPDLMLWLGDNTYLREVDWMSRSGIFHRYTHSRALPELQPLLAATHHYAIWDDHDYGPNDSDRSYIHKDKTRAAFEAFWGNPTFGLPGQKGITTAFQWGDIPFFLLDNRWFRSPNDCEGCDPTILGPDQREWLIEALCSSRAPFKIVAIGGQVLNPAQVFENYANRHAAEREWLLRRIEEENIQGVIFLSGDRHHTELTALQNGRGNMVYDLTASPLTSSGARRNEHEGNTLRVPGTYVNDRNFATLTFSGKRNQRLLTIRVFDADGQLRWQEEIEQPGKK